MRRREVFPLLVGTAAWPLVGRAQQGERMPHIGVLTNFASDDAVAQARMTAFMQALQQLGWTDGRNVRIEVRWGADDADRFRKYAVELVALSPDVILTSTTTAAALLLKATRTVPIVFVNVIDPVGAGLVASLARPGGNTTGFLVFEYGIGPKWLEFLKQIAPRVTRAAVLGDPATSAGIGQLAAIQSVAPSFGVELTPVDVRDPVEIERAITELARGLDGGLIVTASPSQGIHRDLIIRLAAQHALPAVYPFRYMITSGGLILRT